MHRHQFIILIVVLTMGFAACNRSPVQESQGIVSVSIVPLEYLIDRLTDSSLDVNVMVPAGVSHATYSPTPMQLQRLSDSDIYFAVGHMGYEQAFLPRLSEINPGMRLVQLSDKVALIRGEEIDHGDHVHEGGIDPHIWMSPAVMMELLPVIRDAVLEAYPYLEEVVDKRYEELFSDIESVHLDLGSLAGGLKEKSFLIFHPALTYMARDYGLEQIPIERYGKEPSPALLRHIIDKAREHNISLIFIQQEFDVRNARLVSDETGAQLVQINPLAYDWKESMEHIMEAFKIHLQ